MKSNKVKLYATALADKLSEKNIDGKKITKRFVEILVKERLLGKADEILRMAQAILLKNKGNKKIVFETARKITQKQKESLQGFVKKGDVVEEKINPSLIAGTRIIVDGTKQFDASLAHKLQNIF